MTVDEVNISAKNDAQFLLRMLHNSSVSHEPFYVNHSHAELEIVLFTNASSGVYRVNKNKEYRFKTGDIFLFGSNEDHVVTAIHPRGGSESICIHFKPQFIWSPGNEWFDIKYLQSFYDRCSGFRHHLPGELPVTKAISKIMYQIEQEFAQKLPEYELQIKIHLLSILVELNRYNESSAQAMTKTGTLTSISDRHLQQIERSIHYIDSHIGMNITLDELAAIASMSRSYYSRLFRMLNGMSPWDYLLTKRVELAQRYLLQTNDSMLEIASRCGFNSSANFNHCFKRVTGRTPTQYKQQNKAENSEEAS